MVGFDDAFALSESLLAEPLPDRWNHVQSVARQAARLGAVPGVDAEDLRMAAILHDIGYSPSIAHVRFHAAQLKVPAGTVKSRCHRGRARLRLVIRGRD